MRPPIGAPPRSATAAACSVTSLRPYVTRKLVTSGNCRSTNGVPLATTISGRRIATEFTQAATPEATLALHHGTNRQDHDDVSRVGRGSDAPEQVQRGARLHAPIWAWPASGADHRPEHATCCHLRVWRYYDRGDRLPVRQGHEPRVVAQQGDRSLGDVPRGSTVGGSTDHLSLHVEIDDRAGHCPGSDLELKDASQRRLHVLRREGTTPHRVRHPVHAAPHIGGHQQEIISRGDREDRALLDAVSLADCTHVKGVGDGESSEPEGVAEQPSHHRRRQRRGRHVSLHSGHRDVRAHHPGDSRGDRGAEWDQFNLVEPCGVGTRDCERAMRIDIGVPMAGEVLGDRGDPFRLHPGHEARAQHRHTLHILTERADVDGRVV